MFVELFAIKEFMLKNLSIFVRYRDLIALPSNVNY